MSSRQRSIRRYSNSRILVIGDLHAPYQHPDAMDFLGAVKTEYQPDRVICIGDETDGHALSYHEHDPDLDSAGPELVKARAVMQQLHGLFPVMDLLDSNHGSLVYRKGKSAGIPRAYLKPLNEVYGVGPKWRWHHDLIVKTKLGPVYFHHGKTSNVLQLSQAMGMSAVQGHFHEKFGAQYWGNPLGLYFAAQTGCLVDHHSLALAYAKNNLKRPVLGSLVIVEGKPIPVPMVLRSNGRWSRAL